MEELGKTVLGQEGTYAKFLGQKEFTVNSD